MSKLAIGLIILILFSLPVILIQKAITQTTVFYGVKFPSGIISFADEVITYKPKIYFNQESLPNVQKPFDNPQTALGIPNSTNRQNSFLALAQRNDVSLGIGGSLTLQFTNNLLTFSGDYKPDLWVFEAGDKIESVFVEISQDGVTWHKVGKINQQQQGIDIDQFIDQFDWNTDDLFSYVRLTDDPFQGDHEGIWNEKKWIGWGGADIDAVGAISSVSLIPSSSSNFSLLYFPVIQWSLLVFAIFGAGFGISYYLKKVNHIN